MHPVFCREFVERAEHILVFRDALDGLRMLGSVLCLKLVVRQHGVLAGRGQVHFMNRFLGIGLDSFRKLVEDVGSFVYLAALLSGLGKLLAQRRPKRERTVAGRELRTGIEATALQFAQHGAP